MIALLVVLVLIGVALNFVPMEPRVKTCVVVIVIVVAVVVLLSILGLLPLHDIPVPRVR